MARKPIYHKPTTKLRCWLNPEEFDALWGMSYLANTIYMRLRGLMEPDGQVGNSRYVTMSALRELLRVDAGQGKKGRSPRANEVKWCFEKLAEKGLINLDKFDPKNHEKIVLFLPLATLYGEV